LSDFKEISDVFERVIGEVSIDENLLLKADILIGNCDPLDLDVKWFKELLRELEYYSTLKVEGEEVWIHSLDPCHISMKIRKIDLPDELKMEDGVWRAEVLYTRWNEIKRMKFIKRVHEKGFSIYGILEDKFIEIVRFVRGGELLAQPNVELKAMVEVPVRVLKGFYRDITQCLEAERACFEVNQNGFRVSATDVYGPYSLAYVIDRFSPDLIDFRWPGEDQRSVYNMVILMKDFLRYYRDDDLVIIEFTTDLPMRVRIDGTEDVFWLAPYME